MKMRSIPWIIATGLQHRFFTDWIYKWPVTDDRYLESAIEALDRLAFFD